jgi:quinol monooxygenase YgiN
MSQQLTIVAHLVARPEKLAEVKAFLQSLVAVTRAEPGCIDYHLHQDDATPTEFTFYENWTSRADWDVHMTTPNLKTFMERVNDYFSAPPQIRLMTMISPRG